MDTKNDRTEIREKTTLIDAIILSNIKILNIADMDLLVRRQILEVSNSPAKYVTISGQVFTRLCIEDKLIDKLVAGCKITKGKKIDYGILQCTIKSEMGNLNCLSVTECLKYIKSIQKYFEDEYGIITDFSAMTLKKIEINRTFLLEDNFKDYHRIFLLMMSNLPGYLKNQIDFKENTKKGIEYGTYLATSARNRNSERCLTLKIYNKSKQLEKRGIVLGDNCARVEIALMGTEKIKKSLGTNYFHELTDEIINSFFDEQMKKMFVQPLEKWQEERDKYVIKLMKKQRKLDLQHWQVNVLRILVNEEIEHKKPIILDITQLMPLVDHLGLSTKCKYDVRVRFRSQSKKYEKVFCKNDNARLWEILTKLVDSDTKDITLIDRILRMM